MPHDVVAAELRVVRNLRTHSTVDVAADRLERLAEAAVEHDEEAATEYRLAAELLAEHDASGVSDDDPLAALDNMVRDPWGVESFDPAPRGPESPRATDPALDLLGWLLRRAAVARGSRDIGEALGLETEGVLIDRVLTSVGADDPVGRVTAWFDDLDDRSRDIVRRRVLCSPADRHTLEAVGADWGLTRERIRQIEKGLRNRIEADLRELAGHVRVLIREGLPTVVRRDLLTGRLAAATESGRSDLSDLLRHLSGPWEGNDDFVWPIDEASRVRAVIENLRNHSEPHHTLSHEDVAPTTELVAAEDVDGLLASFGINRVGSVWVTRPTLRARVYAALLEIGEPATKEQVAELVGNNPRLVGSTLGNLPGVVRADRRRWALEDWVEDPYTGIAGEIEQRIDAAGGSIPVGELLREIPERFGVSEGSVRAYLGTLAFSVEDGMVLRGDPSAFEPRDPSGVPQSELTQYGWGQVVRLGEEHLERGYSLHLSPHVAHANGIRPDDSLLVPLFVEPPDSGLSRVGVDVSVIWRLASVNGAVEVGRGATALRTTGLHVGQQAMVVPTPSAVYVFAQADASN